MFATPSDGRRIQRSQTVDGEHGRIETRRHTICHDVDWLFSERRYPGAFRFPGLAAVGMVESETERNRTIERQKRYYLCSTRLDVDSFARIVRGHWGQGLRMKPRMFSSHVGCDRTKRNEPRSLLL